MPAERIPSAAERSPKRRASSAVWAELGERGMAKGRDLTPLWRDVVAGLSRERATAFCNALKAAGRDCIVR